MVHSPLAARGSIRGPLAVGAGGAAVAGLWYDPNGVFAADGGNLYAWRAQNTPGSVWPGGPANYAATLTDQASGVVAAEGNGVVAWAAATGWNFTAALAQYLNTTVVPIILGANWSMFMQFSDVANDAYLCGELTGGGRDFYLRPNRFGNSVTYANGGAVIAAIQLLTGNIGIGGNQGYRNGVADGAVIPAPSNNSGRPIWIGGAAIGGGYITSDIAALWVYDQNPALVQAQAVLADGFRAAMGQL